MNKKVIVGMSGGVDSSVTAILLKEQGYEVEGVSLILFDPQSRKALGKAPCCSVEAVSDASKTADVIGIKHSHIDVRDLFSEKVIRPFIESYSKGLTPNPCILCNKFIKFPSLIKAADARGFDFIATGHYARVQRTGTGAQLCRGLDNKKDQSYVLYALSRDIVNRLILPLGEKTKPAVREIAHRLSLPSANRPESQEICFIEERNYVAFMDGLAEEAKGPVIDIETKKQIGNHGGIHLYTIGQRKRLPAMGKPVYVVKIDPSANAIYTGPREMAQMSAFTVQGVNWLVDPHSWHMSATVKVRSTMKDEQASLQIIDSKMVRVDYCEPQWAPSPGQSSVFYYGDIVLGGGVIAPY
jgi:tRNA-specific 2-thiouridylase